MKNVTCKRCKEILATCPKNEYGFALASLVYDVGNTSKVELGHQFYHTKNGQVAICVATKTIGKT